MSETNEIRLKHITRIDNHNTHGWYVRVQKNGVKFEKLFSDLKLGGKDWALFCAMIYLDEAIEKLMRLKSSKPKVHLRRCKKRSRGYEYEVFEISWCPEPNRRIKKSFSIKKYGEEKAFKKAKSWVKAIEEKL